MSVDELLVQHRFPRSARYHPEWIRGSVSGGACALWLTEWLSEALDLQRGMRVLDLGCGRAASSIFLRREFGVEVWGVDLWFDPSENWERVRDAGVSDGVFPMRADARNQPFPAEFFDAVLSVDAFSYFGTDDLYLMQLARLVRPGGRLAIAGAGLMQELEGAEPPEHLRTWWTPDLWCLHSAPWWKCHWQRSGLVEVLQADTLPEGWKYWHAWLRVVAPENTVEVDALSADHGRFLGYVRVVARRAANISLAAPISTVATAYQPAPLLRDAES